MRAFVVSGLVFFHTEPRGGNVSEITYFVSSGTQNLNLVNLLLSPCIRTLEIALATTLQTMGIPVALFSDVDNTCISSLVISVHLVLENCMS